MHLCASLARQSTGLYFRAAVGRLIPEWQLRNWIHIAVVYLTFTGIYVTTIRRVAPDSCKEQSEQLVRLLRSAFQPRGFLSLGG